MNGFSSAFKAAKIFSTRHGQSQRTVVAQKNFSIKKFPSTTRREILF